MTFSLSGDRAVSRYSISYANRPLYVSSSHWRGDNLPGAVQRQRYCRSPSAYIRHLPSGCCRASPGGVSKPGPAADMASHPCTQQGPLFCKEVYKCPVFLPYRLQTLRFVLVGYTNIRFCEAEVHFFKAEYTVFTTTGSIILSSTARLRKSSRDQVEWPSGAGLQDRWIRRACWSPCILQTLFCLGVRWIVIHSSKTKSTKRLMVQCTVEVEISRLSSNLAVGKLLTGSTVDGKED